MTGSGQLMDVLLAELTRRFTQATLYDRSSATTRRRAAEVELGAKGLLRARDRAWARRVAKNLASPPPIHITVDFRRIGKQAERASIRGRRGSKRLSFRAPQSLPELDSNVRRIVAAIQALL